jgi:hypothetical protein
VLEAVDDNLSVAWKSHRIRNSPVYGEGAVNGEEIRLGIDHHIRPRTGLDLLAFDFRLHEICTEAHRRGVRSLTFACNVDSFEADFGDEPDSPPSPREAPEHGYVTTQCLLSTARASEPSWDEIVAARWGGDARHEEYVGGARHDVIGSHEFRRLQYFGLVRQVVNRLASDIPAHARTASATRCRQDPGISSLVHVGEAVAGIEGRIGR